MTAEPPENRALEVTSVFARLADALHPQYDVIDTMDVLVEAATNFTSAVEAGLLLADTDGALHVVASTSERAADVEEAELGVDEGPCLDTFRSGRAVETPRLSAFVERWPAFVPMALKRGLRAGYAVPLVLRDERVGALNLFFDREDPLTDIDAAVTQSLADFATIGIVQHRELRQHANRAAQLQHALDSRIVIEQAKGALSFQRGVSIDQAFRMLRQHARSANARLHDIAEQIVTRQLTL